MQWRETEGLGGGGAKVPGNVWGQEWGICEYADTVYPLLETDGWLPPGRSVSPHLGGGGTVVALFPPPVPFPLVIWDCLTPSLSPPFCLSLSNLTLWPPVRFSLPVLHPLLG